MTGGSNSALCDSLVVKQRRLRANSGQTAPFASEWWSNRALCDQAKGARLNPRVGQAVRRAFEAAAGLEGENPSVVKQRSNSGQTGSNRVESGGLGGGGGGQVLLGGEADAPACRRAADWCRPPSCSVLFLSPPLS